MERDPNCPKWLEVAHCTLRRWDSTRRSARNDDRNWDRLWVDSRRFGREASSTCPADVAGRGSSRRRADMWGNAFGVWDGRIVGPAEVDRVRIDRLAAFDHDLCIINLNS